MVWCKLHLLQQKHLLCMSCSWIPGQNAVGVAEDRGSKLSLFPWLLPWVVGGHSLVWSEQKAVTELCWGSEEHGVLPRLLPAGCTDPVYREGMHQEIFCQWRHRNWGCTVRGHRVRVTLCLICKQWIGRRNENCETLQWLAVYHCFTKCPILKDGVGLSSFQFMLHLCQHT